MRNKEKEIRCSKVKTSLWIPVCYSWLFPGLGHAHIKRRFRGIIFALLYISLNILVLFLLFGTTLSFWVLALILLCVFLVYNLLAAADVYRCAKNGKGDSLKLNTRKDPWLAIFLSLIFPGLGHAYLRSWVFAVVYSLGYIWIDSQVDLIGIDTVLKIAISIHIFIIVSGKHNLINKEFLRFIGVIFLVSFCMGNIVVPFLKAEYVLNQISGAKGISMEPTIKEGDHLLVNRFIYYFTSPKVNDIVCFEMDRSEDLSIGSIELQRPKGLTKRIVAVGGDTVKIKGNSLYVNGKFKRTIEQGINIEQLTVQEKMFLEAINTHGFGYATEYKVPDNCFFVIGDVGQFSFDSRVFGSIHKDAIIGKIFRIILPLDREQVLVGSE